MNSSASCVTLVNRLRFRHLSLLVALDDARNLHQAAADINVAQPSASRMLADIEEAFGFALFERHARGMVPTPLGIDTLAYARQSLAHLTRFAEALEVKRKGGHGQLTVGAIMGAAPDLVAVAVADLKAERPLLNVRILGETSDQVVELLERREIDLALGRFTHSLQHNHFDFEPIANETMKLVRTGAASADRPAERVAGRARRVAVGRAADHEPPRGSCSRGSWRRRDCLRPRISSSARRSSRRCNFCRAAMPSRCCRSRSRAII